jgi:hypothetical protein
VNQYHAPAPAPPSSTSNTTHLTHGPARVERLTFDFQGGQVVHIGHGSFTSERSTK